VHAFTGGVLSDARSRYASHDLCKRSGVAIGSTLEMFGPVNARSCDLADQVRLQSWVCSNRATQLDRCGGSAAQRA
jgi:hypothetical protein